MPTSADKGLYLNINSTGWIFATVIFLMLIFVMAIVNSIFFIRIYNQSKDRDTGTGITGLTVTGSIVIGVISIILGVIAFVIFLCIVLVRHFYVLESK
jgi:heme/copper-type cytochrome/quinol oxidase subunit 2